MMRCQFGTSESILNTPRAEQAFIEDPFDFHWFLQEKGYLKDSVPLVSLIDRIEPDFIDVLRKQFS